MAQTFGQYLVNEALPTRRSSAATPLDKNALHQELYNLARTDVMAAAQALDKVRKLGHEIATRSGFTIGMDDIKPMYNARDKIIKPALQQLKKTNDPARRRKIILKVQDKIFKLGAHYPGSQGTQVQSGAKGAMPQLVRSFITPVAAREATGRPYPWLITRSFAEGLRPSEAAVANVETRNNQISASLKVSEPGDMAKILANNMNSELIVAEDCGTRNGVAMSSDDSHIIDRFTAATFMHRPRNTLVTPELFNIFKKKKAPILVRSPMTCEAHDGVCQKCYGLNENGHLTKLGVNVGIRSAQAITEPLTQFTLSAKHGVQQAGEKSTSQIAGLKGLRDFLDMPGSYADKAAVATEDGAVTSVTAAPQGGHHIILNDTDSYYVPPHLKPVVKVGTRVNAGDNLSTGVPLLKDVAQYKGLGDARIYSVKQLHAAYKNQGIDVDKRHLEMLAKSHINYVQIDHDPAGKYLPGDIVDYNRVMRDFSKRRAIEVPSRNAVGHILARPVLHYAAGTKITPAIVKHLPPKILVLDKPPTMRFTVPPITMGPLLNPDWMARLGHRYLKDSILDGVGFGQTANINSRHPIPAYTYGVDFGRSKINY